MKVLITGATGLIGRALAQRLLGLGHGVVALSRDAQLARSRLGPDVELASTASLGEVVARVDAVVNLAGEPVIGRRWSDEQKKRLVDSRVDLTRRLVSSIAAAKTRPKVLVSASAIGIYGDRGDEFLDEKSETRRDFLAQLCVDWEAAAFEARTLGVRVVCPRIGLVLSTESGALASMLPAFRFGGGGPIGNGSQYYAWIHLDDMVEMLLTALTDETWEGPVNATAPTPVRQKEFASTLAGVLHRPAFVPAPGFALKVALGEAGTVLLASQHVLPRQAQAWGYTFRFPELEPALNSLVGGDDGITVEAAANIPDSEYLRKWPPSYHLRQVIDVPAPVADVFRFFSRAQNLGLVTPSWLSWRIESAVPDPLAKGTTIDYAIKLGPIPLAWRTVIEGWEDGKFFCDAQHKGPYRAWWHEHRFEAIEGGTRVTDDVYYSLPFSPFSRPIHAAGVGPTLRAIFGYRREAISRLFPKIANSRSTRAPAAPETTGRVARAAR